MPQSVLPMGAWAAAVMAAGGTVGSSSIAHRNLTFTVTDQHLKLLKAMSHSVEWSSVFDGTMFGSPVVNPRRPYGDGAVLKSMIRVLEYKMPMQPGPRPWDPELDEIPDGTYNTLEQIHSETEIALKICLNRQAFETGQFYWPEPGEDWVRVVE